MTRSSVYLVGGILGFVMGGYFLLDYFEDGTSLPFAVFILIGTVTDLLFWRVEARKERDLERSPSPESAAD